MKTNFAYRTTWFILMIVASVAAPRGAAARGDVSNKAESKPAIDSTLRERLYTKGPPAWDRIRKRNQQVEYFIRKQFSELDSQQTPRSDTTMRRIKIDGINVLVEELETPNTNIYVNDAPIAETPFPGDFQPLRVEGSNDRYEFLIGRKTAASDWSIRYFVPLDGPGDPALQWGTTASTIRKHINGIDDNTELGWLPLSQLINDPRFTLYALRPVTINGHECVKATFSYTTTLGARDGGSPVREGWFVVDPQYAWGLRAFRIQMDQGDDGIWTRQADFSYADKSTAADSSPILRSSVSHMVRESDHYGWISRVYYNDVKFGPIPAEEFRLSAYGLPEPNEEGTTESKTVTLRWDPQAVRDLVSKKDFVLSVVISNDGDDPCQIYRMLEGCDPLVCVSTDAKFPVNIPAYSEYAFDVKVSPRRVGEFTKWLVFYTDAPGQLKVVGKLKGTIRPASSDSTQSPVN